nr:hypothetical protein [uncultured Duganella sp.]
MKKVFVKDGVVSGFGTVLAAGVSLSSGESDALEFELALDSPVDVGWQCDVSGSAPVFTPGVAPLPLLTPMTLYMAFTAAERIAIKTSKDPLVAEFWAMYQLSAQLEKPTDPNLVSVKEAITYLAAPVSPGPGAGILASAERVPQILLGIPQ